MKVRNVLKKLAAVTLSAGLAVTGLPSISEAAAVTVPDTTSVVIPDTCNVSFAYDAIANYSVGNDAKATGFYLVITNDEEAKNKKIDETNIEKTSTGGGVIYKTDKMAASTATQNKSVRLKEAKITKEGKYTVYYKYGSTFNSKTVTLVKGPEITGPSLQAKSNGFDMKFKFTSDNEKVSYEWKLYEQPPIDSSVKAVDSIGPVSVEANTDISISSTKILTQSKDYYLVLSITGEKTKARYAYGTVSGDDYLEYYKFTTTSDGSQASGVNTGVEGSSAVSTAATTYPADAKKTSESNKDGSTTLTVTWEEKPVKVKVIENTRKDGSVRTIRTDTNTSTGEVKVRDTERQTDGAYVEDYAVIQKDKSYTIENIEATAKGVKSVTAASFSAAGKLTSVSERTLDKDDKTTAETAYKIGSSDKLTITSIATSATKLDISDLVTVSSMTKHSEKDGIETKDTDYKVVAIGANVLKGNKKIKKVTINSDIKSIGKNAFAKAKNLKSIEFAGPVTSIGKGAFVGINKKATITVIASKAQVNAVKKLLKKAGVAKTVKVKKA